MNRDAGASKQAKTWKTIQTQVQSLAKKAQQVRIQNSTKRKA